MKFLKNLCDSVFKTSVNTSVPLTGNGQGDGNVNVIGNNNQIRIDNDAQSSHLPNDEIFNMIIQGAGIRVNRKNLEPICPLCYSRSKVSYLHYKESERDLYGDLSSAFECLETGCNFHLPFVHEKPWREMFVDC